MCGTLNNRFHQCKLFIKPETEIVTGFGKIIIAADIVFPQNWT